MTNRRLRKILKENSIQPNEGDNKESAYKSIKIPRRFIMRTAQLAACLLLVGAIGFGWVTMVRMVGRPEGDDSGETSNDINNNVENTTSQNPAFQPETEVKDSSNIESTTTSGNVEIFLPDFPQQTLTFFYLDETTFDEMSCGESTGDVAKDTVVMREDYIKSSMGIQVNKLSFINSSDLVVCVNTSVLSGTETGIIAADNDAITQLVVSGSLQNMLDTAYLDFTKDYWSGNLVSDLSIGNKLYFASGVISTNTVASMYMTIFNKTALAASGLGSPYDLVDSGNWTLDKLLTLSTGAYIDLDGNAVANDNDSFGLITSQDGINALACVYGIRLIDNSNSLALSSALSDGSAAAFCDKLAAAVTAKDTYIVNTEFQTSAKQNFTFAISTWYNGIIVNSRTDLGYEIGIMPLPKYDVNSDYYTPVSDDAIYYAISYGADTDMTSAVIQYYASSANDISMVLRMKYCFDEKSYINLELMNDTMTFDLCRVLASQTNGLDSLLPTAVAGGTDGYNTVIAGIDAYSSAISDLASKLK